MEPRMIATDSRQASPAPASQATWPLVVVALLLVAVMFVLTIVLVGTG